MAEFQAFADQLPVKDRQIFMKMLNDCYKYSTAINAKGQPFPSEPVIMALLLSQHKLIEWLENQWKKVSNITLLPVGIEDFSEEAKYRHLYDKLSVHNVGLYWSLSSWF